MALPVPRLMRADASGVNGNVDHASPTLRAVVTPRDRRQLGDSLAQVDVLELLPAMLGQPKAPGRTPDRTGRASSREPPRTAGSSVRPRSMHAVLKTANAGRAAVLSGPHERDHVALPARTPPLHFDSHASLPRPTTTAAVTTRKADRRGGTVTPLPGDPTPSFRYPALRDILAMTAAVESAMHVADVQIGAAEHIPLLTSHRAPSRAGTASAASLPAWRPATSRKSTIDEWVESSRPGTVTKLPGSRLSLRELQRSRTTASLHGRSSMDFPVRSDTLYGFGATQSSFSSISRMPSLRQMRSIPHLGENGSTTSPRGSHESHRYPTYRDSARPATVSFRLDGSDKPPVHRTSSFSSLPRPHEESRAGSVSARRPGGLPEAHQSDSDERNDTTLLPTAAGGARAGVAALRLRRRAGQRSDSVGDAEELPRAAPATEGRAGDRHTEAAMTPAEIEFRQAMSVRRVYMPLLHNQPIRRGRSPVIPRAESALTGAASPRLRATSTGGAPEHADLPVPASARRRASTASIAGGPNELASRAATRRPSGAEEATSLATKPSGGEAPTATSPHRMPAPDSKARAGLRISRFAGFEGGMPFMGNAAPNAVYHAYSVATMATSLAEVMNYRETGNAPTVKDRIDSNPALDARRRSIPTSSAEPSESKQAVPAPSRAVIPNYTYEHVLQQYANDTEFDRRTYRLALLGTSLFAHEGESWYTLQRSAAGSSHAEERVQWMLDAVRNNPVVAHKLQLRLEMAREQGEPHHVEVLKRNMSAESLYSRMPAVIHANVHARLEAEAEKRDRARAARELAASQREAHAVALAMRNDDLHNTRELKEQQMTWMFVVALARVSAKLSRALEVARMIRYQNVRALRAAVLIQRRARGLIWRRWYRKLRAARPPLRKFVWRWRLHRAIIRKRRATRLLLRFVQEVVISADAATTCTAVHRYIRHYLYSVIKAQRFVRAFLACHRARLIALRLLWNRFREQESRAKGARDQALQRAQTLAASRLRGPDDEPAALVARAVPKNSPTGGNATRASSTPARGSQGAARGTAGPSGGRRSSVARERRASAANPSPESVGRGAGRSPDKQATPASGGTAARREGSVPARPRRISAGAAMLLVAQSPPIQSSTGEKARSSPTSPLPAGSNLAKKAPEGVPLVQLPDRRDIAASGNLSRSVPAEAMTPRHAGGAVVAPLPLGRLRSSSLSATSDPPSIMNLDDETRDAILLAYLRQRRAEHTSRRKLWCRQVARLLIARMNKSVGSGPRSSLARSRASSLDSEANPQEAGQIQQGSVNVSAAAADADTRPGAKRVSVVSIALDDEEDEAGASMADLALDASAVAAAEADYEPGASRPELLTVVQRRRSSRGIDLMLDPADIDRLMERPLVRMTLDRLRREGATSMRARVDLMAGRKVVFAPSTQASLTLLPSMPSGSRDTRRALQRKMRITYERTAADMIGDAVAHACPYVVQAFSPGAHDTMTKIVTVNAAVILTARSARSSLAQGLGLSMATYRGMGMGTSRGGGLAGALTQAMVASARPPPSASASDALPAASSARKASTAKAASLYTVRIAGM